MRSRLRRSLACLAWAAALCLAAPASPARADVIATESAVARVQRPEVARKLQDLGISAEQARERVDAMSDAEILALAERLDALPAGGAFSNEQVLIVVLLVVMIALLI